MGISRLEFEIFGSTWMGWRISFAVAGFVSMALAIAILILLSEPVRFKLKENAFSEVKDAARSLIYLKSFRWLILEGVFDHCRIAAVAFLSMILQHCGIPDSTVGKH